MSYLKSLLPLSALLLSLPSVYSKGCVQIDTSGVLYVFGGSSDVSLGTSGSWASPTATTLTTTGRPPFTGNNTQCLFSQYNNAMYVMDGDASNPSNIYVYNFAAGSWSTQTTSGAPDLSTGQSLLDHDTNVLFTLPYVSTGSSSLYTLDLSTITSTAGTAALAWSAVEQPSFTTAGYQPVMAQASQHINFFGVPGTAAGSANIFVVHFSSFQSAAQTYPTLNGGATFPDSHGVATSVFTLDGSNSAGTQMIFIPDTFDNTYVVTHWTSASTVGSTADAPSGINTYINTTQILPAPTSKDTASTYFAAGTSLIQLTSSGEIYFLTSALAQSGGYAVASSASWTKSSYTYAGLSSSGSTGSTTASVTASGSAVASGSAAASGSARVSGSASAAVSGASASASARSAAGHSVDSSNLGWMVGLLAGVGAGVVALL